MWNSKVLGAIETRVPKTKTRSSAQGNCSAKSLADNVADSSLFSLSSMGGGVWGRGFWGGGFRWGEGSWGKGTFHPPAIYCTTTWCFALNRLRKTRTCRCQIRFHKAEFEPYSQSWLRPVCVTGQTSSRALTHEHGALNAQIVASLKMYQTISVAPARGASRSGNRMCRGGHRRGRSPQAREKNWVLVLCEVGIQRVARGSHWSQGGFRSRVRKANPPGS